MKYYIYQFNTYYSSSYIYDCSLQGLISERMGKMWKKISIIKRVLLKIALFCVELEEGKLEYKGSIIVKEKLKDGTITTKKIKDRKEFLALMYLPLKEFTNRYIDLIDENGMEHKNDELIAYRNNIHKTYKKLIKGSIIVFIGGYLLNISCNIISNYIPIIK